MSDFLNIHTPYNGPAQQLTGDEFEEILSAVTTGLLLDYRIFGLKALPPHLQNAGEQSFTIPVTGLPFSIRGDRTPEAQFWSLIGNRYLPVEWLTGVTGGIVIVDGHRVNQHESKLWRFIMEWYAQRYPMFMHEPQCACCATSGAGFCWYIAYADQDPGRCVRCRAYNLECTNQGQEGTWTQLPHSGATMVAMVSPDGEVQELQYDVPDGYVVVEDE